MHYSIVDYVAQEPKMDQGEVFDERLVKLAYCQ